MPLNKVYDVGMKNLILLTSLLLTNITFASRGESLERLNKNYLKDITSKITDSTHSFAFCKLNQVEVEGLDPILKTNRKIQIKDYRPSKGDTNAKTILLLPPTGGENVLDNTYANHFCFRGFRVVLLVSWDHQLESSVDPKMHDRGAIRAAAAIRHTMEFINPKRNTQVGIMGTSVGAISSALGFVLDQRIAAGFFIVGGVGMSEIIGESTEKNLTVLRDQRLKQYNLKNVDEYREFLADKITIDPIDFAQDVNGRPVGFIMANQDITVPTKNQQLFVDNFRPKTLIQKDGDHFKVILKSAATLKEEITDFFKANLQ